MLCRSNSKRLTIILFTIFLLVDSFNSSTAKSASLVNPPGCKYYFDKKVNKNVYTNSDEPPEFPGGAAAYHRFLNKNLRYPKPKGEDLEDLQTKTTIQFIVDTDGTLRNICVDKIENEPPTAFENEVLSVIKKMPNWIPGKCKHKVIAVLHKLPIQVELERE